MNTEHNYSRLYRLTPVGGKTSHYTDSYSSAAGRIGLPADATWMKDMQVGEFIHTVGWTVERVA